MHFFNSFIYFIFLFMFLLPITERSYVKPKQTQINFDIQLKSVLKVIKQGESLPCPQFLPAYCPKMQLHL